ncbi:MAG: hypothetical protein HY682_08415 [Chloroflexi bacterium]|nr:hypothetical protein [Chloroflexota bacterium]
MTVVVFLGPSLPVEDARRVLDAIYLPPACQGDLLSAVLKYRPAAVGLIDGVFHQSLSVWHKEILDALDKGIQVYGAASMGALRAAETARFGTIGVGEIYRRYAAGELEDDDEVAVAQAGPDAAYRALSDAMVNIRATLQEAVRREIVDRESARRIEDIAKRLYFPERRIGRCLDLAETQGVPRQTIDRLKDFVREGYIDLKRQDAVLLLRTLRDRAKTRGARPDPKPPRAMFFEILKNTDRSVTTEYGDIDLLSVVTHAAISEAFFDDVTFAAHNRRIALLFSSLTGIKPNEQEVERATSRFRSRYALDDESALQQWLHANDLTAEEFADLMYSIACCRILHRWSSEVARSAWIRDVLDELRLTGRYVDAKRDAAAAERAARAADPAYDQRSTEGDDLAELAAEQASATGWRLDTDVREWATEVGFKERDDFYLALRRASLARHRAPSTTDPCR